MTGVADSFGPVASRVQTRWCYWTTGDYVKCDRREWGVTAVFGGLSRPFSLPTSGLCGVVMVVMVFFLKCYKKKKKKKERDATSVTTITAGHSPLNGTSQDGIRSKPMHDPSPTRMGRSGFQLNPAFFDDFQSRLRLSVPIIAGTSAICR